MMDCILFCFNYNGGVSLTGLCTYARRMMYVAIISSNEFYLLINIMNTCSNSKYLI